MNDTRKIFPWRIRIARIKFKQIWFPVMNYCIALPVQDPDFGVQLSLRTFPCPFSLVSYEAFYGLRTYISVLSVYLGHTL